MGGVLSLHGVAKKTISGPWYVRFLFVFAIVSSVFALHFILGMGLAFGIWGAIAALVACAALFVIAFWITPRQRGGGAERFYFGPGGVSRVAARAASGEIDPHAVEFLEFPPGCHALLKRVSPVWRTCRILGPDNAEVFAAGVTCADVDAPWVEGCLQAAAHHAELPAPGPETSVGRAAGAGVVV